MIRTSTILLLGLTFFACNPQTHPPGAVEDTIQKITGIDSAVLQQEDRGQVDYSLTGFYQGHTPCEGCDGSEQTLLLKEDGSFMLQDLPRQDHAVKYEGVWGLAKGNIVLFSNNVVIGKFLPESDKLLTVQRQGTRLSDSASRKFALIRRPNASQQLSYRKQLSNGLNILAIGTEPFWSLKLDSQSAIIFQLADWTAAKKFSNAKVFNSTDSLTLTSTTPDSIAVTILKEFCSDGMSDLLFEYKVRVKHGGREFNGCAVLRDNFFPDQKIIQ